MFRKSRFYFSAMCAALVLVSLLMTSTAGACEEEPQSLLTVYMNSDIVVLARYEANGETKKSFEDEYGYTLDIERKLSISKIYKGQKDLRNISFILSEYQANPVKTEAETETVTEETVPEEEGEYNHEDYFDVSKIKIGTEYLFFLKKNAETGEYNVADYMSGAREITGKEKFYQESLSELERIASAKENQYELLTEWIVKSIENADSREDGIRDLSESFYGLEYQAEDPAFKDKGPFVINEGYGVYTVGVAKHLTQAQKARISAVLYPMLQESWFAETPEYANYQISSILGGIDKSRLAVNTYNSLQTVGKDDFERKRVIMEFLTSTVSDETLSKLYYDYSELEMKIEELKKETTPEAKTQLKTLNLSKETMLKDFDKRFKFLHGRNFLPVETAKL